MSGADGDGTGAGASAGTGADHGAAGRAPAAVPESLRRLPDGGVEIGWSDGLRSAYSPRLLRDACPCATCREERAAPKPKGLLPVLSPQDLAPLSIASMRPVGQYAYGIEFTDGHSSGIYTLDYLRELG